MKLEQSGSFFNSPTEHFTIPEPQNPSIDRLYVDQKRLSADFLRELFGRGGFNLKHLAFSLLTNKWAWSGILLLDISAMQLQRVKE